VGFREGQGWNQQNQDTEKSQTFHACLFFLL
jgi:hypothetical protein